MKPPTKKELQALAVRALGEGGVVETDHHGRADYAARAYVAGVGHPYIGIAVNTMGEATRALAAALRALAGEE